MSIEQRDELAARRAALSEPLYVAAADPLVEHDRQLEAEGLPTRVTFTAEGWTEHRDYPPALDPLEVGERGWRVRMLRQVRRLIAAMFRALLDPAARLALLERAVGPAWASPPAAERTRRQAPPIPAGLPAPRSLTMTPGAPQLTLAVTSFA